MKMSKKFNKYDLYEASVQDAEYDIHLIDRLYRKRHGKKPSIIREDFCGSGLVARRLAKKGRSVIGIDNDPGVIQIASDRRHPNTDLKLLLCDVKDATDLCMTKVDVVLAQNFSYCVFKTREELYEYYDSIYRGLKKGGMFLTDVQSGSTAMDQGIEKRSIPGKRGVKYVWEQCVHDAFTGNAVRYIHFEFSDGSKMRRAFTYDWRIWSMWEMCEMLSSVFDEVEVYIEGRKAKPPIYNEPAYVAQLVAWHK